MEWMIQYMKWCSYCIIGYHCPFWRGIEAILWSLLMWTWVEMLSFCESLLCLDDRSEWDVLLCRKIKNSWLRTCYLYRSHFKYRPVIYFTIIGIIYKWRNWNNFLKMKILRLVIRVMRKGMKSIQILKQKTCKTRELKTRTWPWMTQLCPANGNYLEWVFVCSG